MVDTDEEQPRFKTLFQEEQEKRGKPPKLTIEQKIWEKLEAHHYKICPILGEDAVCRWSIKFSKLPPFLCHGRDYEERCSVYKKVMDNGGDPLVLLNEG